MENLANKIEVLNEDKDLYLKIVNNIYDFSEQLLWHKRGTKILNFINEI